MLNGVCLSGSSTHLGKIEAWKVYYWGFARGLRSELELGWSLSGRFTAVFLGATVGFELVGRSEKAGGLFLVFRSTAEELNEGFGLRGATHSRGRF